MKQGKFRKFISTICIFALVLACFSYANYTSSYFTDIERTDNNEYLASVLDLELDVKNDFMSDIFPGETKEKEIVVINSGTLPFRYYILADIYESNNPLCNSLYLSLSRDGVDIYNGALINFNVSNIYLANEMSDDLVFRLSLLSEAGYFSNTCEFNFLFTAQQSEFVGTNLGFDDDEIMTNSITGGGQAIILNEILPNPEGFDNQEGLLGEWVEIYNSSNSTVDLVDWYIEDDSASGNRQTISNSNTLFNSTLIGPKGSDQEWLVVFMTGDVLGNVMDTVSLYDNFDNLIDKYSYCLLINNDGIDPEETPGDTNSTVSGDAVAGNEGKSDARIPDGYGDWVDPVPTPGGINNIDLYDAETIIGLTDISNPITQTIPIEIIAPTTVDNEPLTETPEEENKAETIEDEMIESGEESAEEFASNTETEELIPEKESALGDKLVEEPVAQEEELIPEKESALGDKLVEEPVAQEEAAGESVAQEPSEPLLKNPVETSQGASLPTEETSAEEDLPTEEPVIQEPAEESVIKESTEELPSLKPEVEDTSIIDEEISNE